MFGFLAFLAQYGRFVLVAGLISGLALPDAAMALRPWLSELVLLLIFFTAFRIGFPTALAALHHIRETFAIVLAYQVALPLMCILVFTAFGQVQSPVAIALTLMLAAPSITGAPNLSVMLGHPPEPAFRVLILGTMLLPVTIIPIFWFSPVLGSFTEALTAAIRLSITMGITITIAFGLRAILRPKMKAQEREALDGLNSIALAVIVIGLMSAVIPAFMDKPVVLAGWLLFAIFVNCGLQLSAYFVFQFLEVGQRNVPIAIVAGNRNVAIFLIASSATVQSEEFLIFLGCYQFPMYLTPIIMRPLFKIR